MKNIASLKITATGSSKSRPWGDRLAEIVNVKDYNAKGDGSTDDRAAIQAAIDAAFGPAVAPHGRLNAHLNRTVFFPAGAYNVGTGGLNLTRVVGGKLIGSGALCTSIRYTGSVAGGATITSLFNVNGMARSSIENLDLGISGTNTCAINLDWDGVAGGDGLNGNMFMNLLIEGATNGVLIGYSGNDGANNSFLNVSLNNCGAGIDVRGTDALGQFVASGGGDSCGIIYKMSGGSISSIFGVSVGASDYSIDVAADVSVVICGLRTEQPNILRMSNGLVAMRACSHAPVAPGIFANLTGGKLSIDGCTTEASPDLLMAGNGGTLYLRGNNFHANFLDNFTGTVVENI